MASAPLIRLERLQSIRELIERGVVVRVSDLARELGVSRETVRRDLAALAEEGLLVRGHGGAVSAPATALSEQTTATRERQQAREKRAIGAAGAALVVDGQAVAVDSSTTALALVRLLRGRDLTVITNGLPAAQALVGDERTRVILTGGIVLHGNASLVGPEAEASASRFFPDVAFISAPALSERGVMDTNPFEVAVKRALVEGARSVCVLADHTKFGRTAFEVVTEWRGVDTLITDQPLDLKLAQWLADSDVELLVASQVT